jgi:hypothetical protein
VVFCLIYLDDELNAHHLGASPNDLANPVVAALEKRQLETVRDSRGRLNANFCAVLGDIQNLAFAMRATLNLDPRVKMTDPSDLSLKMACSLHCGQHELRWNARNVNSEN